MTKSDRDASGGRARQGRALAVGILLIVGMTLQACGTSQQQRSQHPPAKAKLTAMSGSANRAVNGAVRTPQQHARPSAVIGVASWYGGKFHGRRTASGEIYNKYALSAAHPTLPFGTRVMVTNLANGRKITLTINDRGPFIKGRIIDVSRRAAQKLGFLKQGITRVRVRVVSVASG